MKCADLWANLPQVGEMPPEICQAFGKEGHRAKIRSLVRRVRSRKGRRSAFRSRAVRTKAWS